MNLEQIDTSTTAGKAEVMRLAAEGRRVATRAPEHSKWWETQVPDWNWHGELYAIISEPVGPEEVWCVIGAYGETVVVGNTRAGVENFGSREGMKIVRYIRADLAGLPWEKV